MYTTEQLCLVKPVRKFMSLQLLFLLQMELRSLFQPSSGLPLSIGREVHKAEGTCPFGPCSTSWPYFGYQGSFNSLLKHLCPCSCLWCLRRPLYCGVNGWNLNEQLWVTICGTLCHMGWSCIGGKEGWPEGCPKGFYLCFCPGHHKC